jgi:hypothetical protein
MPVAGDFVESLDVYLTMLLHVRVKVSLFSHSVQFLVRHKVEPEKGYDGVVSPPKLPLP